MVWACVLENEQVFRLTLSFSLSSNFNFLCLSTPIYCSLPTSTLFYECEKLKITPEENWSFQLRTRKKRVWSGTLSLRLSALAALRSQNQAASCQCCFFLLYLLFIESGGVNGKIFLHFMLPLSLPVSISYPRLLLRCWRANELEHWKMCFCRRQTSWQL